MFCSGRIRCTLFPIRRSSIVTGAVGIAFAAVGFVVTAHVLQRQEHLKADLTARLHDDWRFAMSETTAETLLSLPSSARNMAMASRSALVDSGFSPAFLDTHLFLDHVLPDGDGNWVVQWVFSAGDRRIPLIDHLTVEDDGAVVSSLPSQLGHAHDLTHVLPASEASRALYACLGRTTDEVVLLAAPSPGGSMVFGLHARSQDGTMVGSIDLETGECNRGVLR